MTLNRQVRRSALACLFGAAAILSVAGCGSAPEPTSPKPTISVAPVRLLIAPAEVREVASAFENQFVDHEYADQWDRTGPPGPGLVAFRRRSHRDAHAQVRQGGRAGRHRRRTHPRVRPGPRRSTPSVRSDDVWSFPLDVDFAHPPTLRPARCCRLFAMTSVEIAFDAASGVASVVGEGPESLDAPIILPATVPAVSLDVPILMYHLVDQIPPRSIEPSDWGWRLEVGLTTLPSAFDRRWRTSRASRPRRSRCSISRMRSSTGCHCRHIPS